jgi:predicted metal-dependent hydrolase
MTRKWGSCSTKGIVTFAEDLADQRAGFQDFVVAHELLHLRVRNHGKVFKAFLSMHMPHWREQDMLRMRARTGGSGISEVPPKRAKVNFRRRAGSL